MIRRNISNVVDMLLQWYDGFREGRVTPTKVAAALVFGFRVAVTVVQLLKPKIKQVRCYMTKSKGSGRSQNGFKGFYNHYLEEEHKAAIKKLPMGLGVSVERMEQLLELGYKVTFSYSPDDKAYFCSVTGKKTAGVNVGWVLTQAHAELLVSLACVWFLVVEHYDCDEWPTQSEVSERYNW